MAGRSEDWLQAPADCQVNALRPMATRRKVVRRSGPSWRYTFRLAWTACILWAVPHGPAPDAEDGTIWSASPRLPNGYAERTEGQAGCPDWPDEPKWSVVASWPIRERALSTPACVPSCLTRLNRTSADLGWLSPLPAPVCTDGPWPFHRRTGPNHQGLPDAGRGEKPIKPRCDQVLMIKGRLSPRPTGGFDDLFEHHAA